MAAKWVRIPVEVLARQDLHPAAKLVYGVLLYRCQGKGECWPGIRSLMDMIGLSHYGVRCAIAELEQCGAVCVERRPGGRSNKYSLAPLGELSEPTLGEFSVAQGEFSVAQGEFSVAHRTT